MSGMTELENYCLRAIRGEFETNKIEIKPFLDVDVEHLRSEFLRSMVAIANTPPDPIVPYGLLIVGVKNGEILDNVDSWAKDDNEYQNLVRIYCDPMIKFNFYILEVQNKKFGVFVIENSEHRPHLIKKDLVYKGKVLLARGQIYIREGSITKVCLLYTSPSPRDRG